MAWISFSEGIGLGIPGKHFLRKDIKKRVVTQWVEGTPERWVKSVKGGEEDKKHISWIE